MPLAIEKLEFISFSFIPESTASRLAELFVCKLSFHSKSTISRAIDTSVALTEQTARFSPAHPVDGPIL